MTTQNNTDSNEQQGAGEHIHRFSLADMVQKYLRGELGTARPLCAVHQRLEDTGSLECEVGNGCVACSLNERAELLQLIAPFAAEGNTEDCVTVMRRVAEFYATHVGEGRVIVSYPAPAQPEDEQERGFDLDPLVPETPVGANCIHCGHSVSDFNAVTGLCEFDADPENATIDLCGCKCEFTTPAAAADNEGLREYLRGVSEFHGRITFALRELKENYISVNRALEIIDAAALRTPVEGEANATD